MINKSFILLISTILFVVILALIIAANYGDKQSFNDSTLLLNEALSEENSKKTVSQGKLDPNTYNIGKDEIQKVTWDFTFEKDEMTDATNIWAKIKSDNSFDLDFPYGTSYCTLTIRYMKEYGYDVLVGITSGQIYGNSYRNDNYVMVRFDENKPVKYWFNEPADGSSDCVFIRNVSDFKKRVAKAKDIKVEVPIYECGRPIFRFHVDEPLVWRTE